MKAMRWVGLAGLGLSAVTCVVGCGGGSYVGPAGSAMAPAQPYAPAAEGVSASVSVQSTSPGGGSYRPAEPSPPPPPAPVSASRGKSMDMDGDAAPRQAPRAEAPPADRPGLGTQWGETRTSRISMVNFERADSSSPFAAAALYYNDEEGARAMTASSGYRRTPAGTFTVASGLVSIGLRDEGGRFFTGFNAGGRNYAVGEGGHRYTIVVRNNTNFRLEVVLSVDGLDVLDGKAASFAKRGYIMDARGELEIDGFRQSMDAVAAFRFGSVRGSYAGQKTGDTRNVGVIGVALFNEMGTNPVPWTPDEVQRRRDANPFPGQFATPP